VNLYQTGSKNPRTRAGKARRLRRAGRQENPAGFTGAAGSRETSRPKGATRAAPV
jgi:hypothetical protein